MPIYEYKCEECDYRFEVEQKVTDLPVAKCPLCGGGPVKKLISSPGVIFKGSGFYVTDHRKKDKPSSAKAPEGKPSSGEASEGKPSSVPTKAGTTEGKPKEPKSS